MSLGNFCRTNLTRLLELDFFRRHLSYYKETGKILFETSQDYKEWLREIQPIEIVILDTDDNDDDDKDAKKGSHGRKKRDVKKQEEKENKECNRKGIVDMINVK